MVCSQSKPFPPAHIASIFSYSTGYKYMEKRERMSLARRNDRNADRRWAFSTKSGLPHQVIRLDTWTPSSTRQQLNDAFLRVKSDWTVLRWYEIFWDLKIGKWAYAWMQPHRTPLLLHKYQWSLASTNEQHLNCQIYNLAEDLCKTRWIIGSNIHQYKSIPKSNARNGPLGTDLSLPISLTRGLQCV